MDKFVNRERDIQTDRDRGGLCVNLNPSVIKYPPPPHTHTHTKKHRERERGGGRGGERDRVLIYKETQVTASRITSGQTVWQEREQESRKIRFVSKGTTSQLQN